MGCGCKDKVNKETSQKRNDKLREVSGNIVFNDALTSFLYELIRDHLPAGVVEEIVRNSVNNTEVLFTNGWLAKYSNNLAEELLNAKTNNIKNILSEAFGKNDDTDPSDTRPSFKTEEQVKTERTTDNNKIIDSLLQTGQIKPEEAEEMKKELEELDKETALMNANGKAESK